MVRGLQKLVIQQPNVYDVRISESSDALENMPTREDDDVNDNVNKKEGEEQTYI